MTASRLLFLEDSDWDVHMARKNFDFAGILQRLSDQYQQADAVTKTPEWGCKRRFVDDDHSAMGLHCDRMRWVRARYILKLQAEAPSNGVTAGGVELDQNGILYPTGDFDEAFWQAICNVDGIVVDQF
jgi:hypothetical protein